MPSVPHIYYFAIFYDGISCMIHTFETLSRTYEVLFRNNEIKCRSYEKSRNSKIVIRSNDISGVRSCNISYTAQFLVRPLSIL